MHQSKKVGSLGEAKKIIAPILKKHGATKAGVFGSFARGEVNKNSDLDILIEIDKNLSLLDFIGIKNELEDALKRKVDLVEYGAIKPVIKKNVLSEEVPVI